MATAVIRRDAVLESMVEEGFITEQRERRASRGKVKAVKYDPQARKKQAAAYFIEWLRDDYLDPLLGSCALHVWFEDLHDTRSRGAGGGRERAGDDAPTRLAPGRSRLDDSVG